MSKYDIIYADPAWNYRQKSLNRGGAERYYSTMKVEDIKKINVGEISTENSVLFIWGTWPNLIECLSVIDAWGFKYKTCGFLWVKSNKRTNPKQLTMYPVYDFFMGMGHYTRSNTEYCLFAVKGKGLKRTNAGIRQVVYEPVRSHSEKPPIVRNSITKLFSSNKRIELFARKKFNDWDVWGNEVNSDIEL